MALKTFMNLSSERQKEIIDICIMEFALNDFESASITRILAKLKLARGSFYRYFENKTELYRYLFQQKIAVVERLKKEYLQNPERDFFEAWLDFGIALLKTEAEHPQYLAFLSRVTTEQRSEIFGESSQNSREQQRMGIFGEMIQFHRDSGQLRTDISLPIQTLFLMNTREGIRQYLTAHYQLNLTDPHYRENPFFKKPAKEIRQELHEFVQLLRDALESPQWREATNTQSPL